MTDPTVAAASRRRARWIGSGLAVLIIGLVVAGGVLYMRSEARWQSDPGHSARTPQDLDKILARAEAAERAGDRGSAITSYRFILAVGANGDEHLELYMAAARRGLARLGASQEAQPTP